MSATSAPFGLRAVYSPSGVVRPAAYTITSGYATTIYSNQPVKIVPSSTGEGTIAAAAVGDRFIGTFCGVEFTDTDGRRRVSNNWTASTSATDIVCYVTPDPTIVYEIQSNAALTVAAIRKIARPRMPVQSRESGEVVGIITLADAFNALSRKESLDPIIKVSLWLHLLRSGR